MIIAGHTLSVGHHIQFYLFENNTVAFVFISGFLFQYLSYKFEYKNYLKKKFLNVILPYIITSIPGIIYIMDYKRTNPLDDFPNYIQPILMLLTGILHNPPTWFIIMISFFFIISAPLLFLEKKNILYKLLPVLLLITVLVPRASITGYPNQSFNSMQVFLNYYKQILLCSVNLFSVYVLGMFFSAHKDKINNINLKYLFTLMITIFFLTVYFGMHLHFINTTIDKIIFSIFILTLFKKYEPIIQTKPLITKGLNALAKYSFGLFFIHIYVLRIFEIFYSPMDYSSPNSNHAYSPCIAYQITEFFVVLIVSSIIIYLLKKLLDKLNVKNTRMFIGV